MSVNKGFDQWRYTGDGCEPDADEHNEVDDILEIIRTDLSACRSLVKEWDLRDIGILSDIESALKKLRVDLDD